MIQVPTVHSPTPNKMVELGSHFTTGMHRNRRRYRLALSLIDFYLLYGDPSQAISCPTRNSAADIADAGRFRYRNRVHLKSHLRRIAGLL